MGRAAVHDAFVAALHPAFAEYGVHREALWHAAPALAIATREHRGRTGPASRPFVRRFAHVRTVRVGRIARFELVVDTAAVRGTGR